MERGRSYSLEVLSSQQSNVIMLEVLSKQTSDEG